ncbi:helix-hairpin-helix domain-containing protein, partial [Salipiger sp. HF18]|uniref:helix-hairpin-helix domain-containing protein n=1 Tax=Salipiger sp. HF18 TaxID=2721557 RepID=UPI00142D4DC7|nr:helix-hairpin-helix domain-containing protein [Salipiger sp. HF18]
MTNLTDIRGVGPALASKMREMGIQSAADLARADAERLTALPRVQLIRARMLIAAAEEMLDAAAAGLGSAPTPEVTAKSEAVAMEEPQAVGEPEPEAVAPPEEVEVATATTAKKTKPSKKAKKS